MLKRKEYMICMEIHKKIKERITGNVFISIDNMDTLHVNIKSFRNIKFRYDYPGISYEMIDSYFINSDKIVNIILQNYKDSLMKIFFRR